VTRTSSGTSAAQAALNPRSGAITRRDRARFVLHVRQLSIVNAPGGKNTMSLSRTLRLLGSAALALFGIAGNQHCAQLSGEEPGQWEDEAAPDEGKDGRRCPYDFSSPMPPGVYCAYAGPLVDPNGEVCVEESGVLWSSFDPAVQRARTESLTKKAGRVFFGVALDPEIVLHAASIPNRALEVTIHAYRVGGEDSEPRNVSGRALLIRSGGSAHEEPNKLLIGLAGHDLPVVLGDCRFAFYEGVFVGVLEVNQQ
jgi:hypothetical protein